MVTNKQVCGQILMPYWFAIVIQIISAVLDIFIFLWQTRKEKKKEPSIQITLEEPNVQITEEGQNQPNEEEQNGQLDVDKQPNQEEEKQGRFSRFIDVLIGVKTVASFIFDVVAFIIVITDNVGTTSSTWDTYQCIGVAIANSRVFSSFQSLVLVKAKLKIPQLFQLFQKDRAEIFRRKIIQLVEKNDEEIFKDLTRSFKVTIEKN